MKKLFLIAIVSLLSVCFAEEFAGFQGVAFGTPRKECVSLMKSKGWIYSKPASNKKTDTFKPGLKQHTYAGMEVDYIFFDILDDKLAVVTILFRDQSGAIFTADALKKKYNLKDKTGNKVQFFTDDEKVYFMFDKKTVTIYDAESSKKLTDPINQSDF